MRRPAIFVFAFVVIIVSCGGRNPVVEPIPENVDSLRMSEALGVALDTAYNHIANDSFEKNFDYFIDSSYSISLTVSTNKVLSERQHLFIRRKSALTVCIDIYLNTMDRYEKVLSHEQWELTYTSDTLQDVNGDGYRDFLVNWYGSNGCCLKNFYDVYLFKPKAADFSPKITFINPTFFPKEKIIRGVAYGHPGDTDLYTYKWNGSKVDTIEHISPDRIKKGKYIHFNNRTGKETAIQSVPLEYRNIYGYDWFLGNVP